MICRHIHICETNRYLMMCCKAKVGITWFYVMCVAYHSRQHICFCLITSHAKRNEKLNQKENVVNSFAKSVEQIYLSAATQILIQAIKV